MTDDTACGDSSQDDIGQNNQVSKQHHPVGTTDLPVLDRIPILGAYSNSADQVQMPQNAASDQGLHCLLTVSSMQNTV